MATLSTSKSSILTLAQNALAEIGMPIPNTLVGNTDATAVQILALANREGKDFYRRAGKNDGWQILRKENTFTTLAVSGFTATTTSGSAIITGILPSTTGIVAGYVAVGSGIPIGTTVVSIDSSTQVTLSAPCTSSATLVSVYFGKDNYALPNDMDHFLTQTFWDRSFRWQMLGPLEAQEWQVLKSGISPTGPRRRFRIMNNAFYIDPVPSTAGQVVAYEYMSMSWAQSAAGAAQFQFMADTDFYLLDDDVMTLGLKWRFKQAKGLDYTEELAAYNIMADMVLARDGGMRNLPMNASASGVRIISDANVPDSGFGT